MIPWQLKVIADIKYKYDYSIGTHEVLLSGAIGSGKSILAAHIVIDHAMRFPNARIGIGRRSLPDLKATIFRTITEHLEDPEVLEHVEKILFNTGQIFFKNGSIIESVSWADHRWQKLRSRIYSLFVFEEAIENEQDSVQAFIEIRQRVGRVPHVKENLIIYCTNPGSPGSSLYKYFFTESQPTRHVHFSLTEQNPFLPKSYIEQLKRDLPAKEAQRQIYGQWVEIDKERLYYAYNQEINFLKYDYQVNPGLPISLSFDFNISSGKPMSSVLSQYDPVKDTFHFFDEIIIMGSRTEDQMDELAARGYLDKGYTWEVHGDATGAARTTNSKHSNYDIIEQFLANYKTKAGHKVRYQMLVPRSNPPIRERHNMVNAYCCNTLKQNRLFVYQKCKVLNEGFNLTSLKKGADYVEDDSKHFQHSTTAAGYRLVFTSKFKDIGQARNL